MAKVYLALGSNMSGPMGEPVKTLNAALRMLADINLVITAKSRWWKSTAFPNVTDPEYINGVVEIYFGKSPNELLKALKNLENELGREPASRWDSRIIDLDILSYDNQVFPSQTEFLKWAKLPLTEQLTMTPKILILPHPRIQDRLFVLEPLHEITKSWIHPVFHLTVKEMLEKRSKLEKNTLKPF